MKKQVFIIIGVVLAVIAIGGSIVFIKTKPKDNKNNATDVVEKVEDKIKELEILTSIDKDLGSNKPTLADFNVNVSGDIKIYFADAIYEEETLNKIGTYKVTITVDGKEYSSSIIVSDKEAPSLKLKDVSIKSGNSYKISDFVDSCTDNSKEDCHLEFSNSKMSKYTKVGSYDIEINATDKSDNKSSAKAKLIITENKMTEKPTNTTTNKNENNNTSSTNNNNQKNTSNNNSSNNTNNNTGNTSNNTSNSKLTEAGKLVNSNSSQVNAVIAETNKIREELGLAPLTYSASLTKAAMYRALEISTQSTVSHTRPDGSKFSTVFKELGISYTAVGENLAAGRSNATTTVNDWKGSPGHYANIVDPKFTKIGVGYVYVPGTTYKYYWVQLFSN